ncbi:MAG: putative quinol monooxygenase [Lacipirellulaceae bacterium]
MLAQADDKPLIARAKAELADHTKPFVMVVKFRVLAGQEEAFTEAFQASLAETFKEPGNIAYVLGRSRTNPGEFLLYERWKSAADLDLHLDFPYLVKLAEAFPTLLDGDPEIEFFDPIAP